MRVIIQDPKFITRTFYVFIALILCIQCVDNHEDNSVQERPPDLFMPPKVVKLDTQRGYKVNPFTGDTILPISLSNGNILQSGVPIEIVGKKYSAPIGLMKRTQLKSAPDVTRLEDGIKPYSTKLIDDHVEWQPITMDSIGTLLLNSSGDTVQIGVPIPFSGLATKTIHAEPVKAAQPRYRDNALNDMQYLDVEEGLPSSYINSIFQDSKGNLWFGTFGGGVAKYDGVTFSYFNTSHGLSGNLVNHITEDGQGNIWISTDVTGLNKYDGAKMYHYTDAQGLPNNSVRKSILDRNGDMWICTLRGMSKMSGDTIVNFYPSDRKWSGVDDAVMMQNGDICFAGSRGVVRFDGETFYELRFKGMPGRLKMESIVEDSRGRLWIGGDHGVLLMLENQKLSKISDFARQKSFSIEVLHLHQNGGIWVGTHQGLYHLIDDENCIRFSISDGLANDHVRSITEDIAGNYWFGTYGGGVNRYNPASFNHLTRASGLSEHLAWDIREDNEGNIWFATSNGLNKYDGSVITSWNQKHGIPSNYTMSVLQDNEGQYWVGTQNEGVFILEKDVIKQFTTPKSLSRSQVVSIIQDKNENIWFGTYGSGAYRYDGETVTWLSESENFGDRISSQIYEDSKGYIWFATEASGAAMYDGEHYTFFTEKEGMIHNEVICIEEDSRGNMWFGTFGSGLSIYDGKNFVQYGLDQGLSNLNIWSFLEDEKGHMWVSSDNGIFEFIPTSDTTTSNIPAFRIYNHEKRDGLRGLDFYMNSSCLADDGKMYWGAGKSIMYSDGSVDRKSEDTLLLRMNYLTINDEYLDYRTVDHDRISDISFNEVEQFENYPTDLELPHDKNHLTFHFDGIDWKSPHKVRYSYRMRELNESWSKPTSEAKADYRGLSPGNYTLEVKAIGGRGVWSESVTYSFTILPPWWNTWWARVAYILILLLAIYLFTKWRTRNLKRQQKILEDTVSKRTAEVVKEKERSDELLLNILPAEIAAELKAKGSADAQSMDEVTVIFTDFQQFTAKSALMSPELLVHDLNECFSAFDRITEKYGIEKIKTIGDAYMAAGGLPTPNPDHALNVVNAALDIRDFIDHGIENKKAAGLPFFEIRIGIHTGPVVAGIVGVKKFQYDIWGDTVNTAARMETNCEAGRVNVSKSTYDKLKNHSEFRFEYRGMIKAKGKGEIEMWFVERSGQKIRSEITLQEVT